MTRATTFRRKRPSGRTRVLGSAALPLAVLMMLGPGAADAGAPVKGGQYKGSTAQQAVSAAFRKINFTVKKGKVVLTTEPTVARESCLSTPVFTLEGTASKKLGKNRSFTFTHTFLGNKIDKIHGRFVAPDEVEGFALYHFSAQDLCSEGKAMVSVTAKHK